MTRIRSQSILAIACLGAVACGPAVVPPLTQPQPRSGVTALAPEAIYHNARVVTLDSGSTIAQAIAVQDGRIVAVGADAEVRALAGTETRLVDLAGRTVLPGLYDNHVHIRTGRDPSVHDWTHVDSPEALFEELRRVIAATPEGEWIQAGLSTELMPEQILPYRADLDRIAPRHPVALERMHVMLVNSLALERAGIDSGTPDPDGGSFDRDARGELNGRVRETPAQRIVEAAIPPWVADAATARAAIRASLRGFAAEGLTSVNAAGLRPDQLAYVQEVYSRWGDELPRLTLQVRISPGYDTYDDTAIGIEREIELIEGLRFHTGMGDERFKLGAIKMSVDGGMTGQAAWTAEPYRGRPDYHGVIRIPEEVLYAVGKRAHDLGWQLGIHAIGDGAVESTLRVYDRILRESPREGARHYIHHFSVNPNEETLRRVEDLDIIIASQPNFTHSLAPYYSNALEGERLQTNNPNASLLRRGIRVSYGSDGLPVGPFVGLYTAVTRRGVDGTVYDPAERVGIEEALRLYTQGTAYMTFDEDRLGSLEVGKLADFVVISEDIMTIAPERIKEIEPLMTVVDGWPIWSASTVAGLDTRNPESP